MEIVKFIFYLGIIYTIFGLLWGIVTFLYKAVRVEVTNTESTILKMGSYYFLASLTAWNVVKPFNATDRASGSYAYIALGGIVLCFYLIGKLQKSRIQLFFKALFYPQKIIFRAFQKHHGNHQEQGHKVSGSKLRSKLAIQVLSYAM